MNTGFITDYDFERRVLRKEGGAKTFWIEINIDFAPMNILLTLADGQKGNNKEGEIINFFSSLGKQDALYTAEVKGKIVIAKYVHATSTISFCIEKMILELPYQPSATMINEILADLRRKEGEE